MKFELTIDCDNAAFDKSNGGGEELIRCVTKAVEQAVYFGAPEPVGPKFGGTIRDSNGDWVGNWANTPDEETYPVDDREFLQPDLDEELS